MIEKEIEMIKLDQIKISKSQAVDMTTSIQAW